MTIAQSIVQHIEAMPESALREILDFVEFLETKNLAAAAHHSDQDWSRFSLAAAMRGLENEQSPYTIADIRQDTP